MPRTKRTLTIFLMLLAFSSAILPVRAQTQTQCRVRRGEHIVLYGASDDPDVFVWDSRFRMRDYAEGSFDHAQALLPHARLAQAGTRAIVAACSPGFVVSKYDNEADDAIGILIVSGRYRGGAGWVLGTEIRTPRSR